MDNWLLYSLALRDALIQKTKNIQISNFLEIRPMGAKLFHADGQTWWRQVTFYNFAKAPKKITKKSTAKHFIETRARGSRGWTCRFFNAIFIIPTLCGLLDTPLRLIAPTHTHSGYEYVFISGLTSPPSSHNFRNLSLVTGSLYPVGVNYGRMRDGRQMR